MRLVHPASPEEARNCIRTRVKHLPEHMSADGRCRTSTIEWDRWSSRMLGDALLQNYRETCGCLPQGLRAVHPTTSRLQYRLRKQGGRSQRIILEQRQMRLDIFRAPQPRSIRPGQVQWRNPKRTGDGANEHRAIARKPSETARVERLLRALDSPSWKYYFKRSKSLPPPKRASATIMICVRYRSKNSFDKCHVAAPQGHQWD
jgi:hypothetical protein